MIIFTRTIIHGTREESGKKARNEEGEIRIVSNGRARLIDGRPKEVSVTPTSAIKWINYGNNWSDQSGQGAIGEQCRSNYIPVEVVRLAQPSSCTRACMHACMHACGGWCTMDARRRFLQREVDEVREGASVTRGGGERRRNMRVGEPRQGCTPWTGGGCWCSLDFCPRNEKPRKREREVHTDRLASNSLWDR